MQSPTETAIAVAVINERRAFLQILRQATVIKNFIVIPNKYSLYIYRYILFDLFCEVPVGKTFWGRLP